MKARAERPSAPPLARLRCTVAVLLSIGTWSPATMADESRADELFREGRRLLANGQIAEACDKFAESHREDASSGSLLNLARCHAQAGLPATAWAEYRAAAELARAQNRPEQAAEAELRAAELAPQLMQLVIQLEANTAGVVVTRNGVPLAESELGKPVPVDPGSHLIRVTAAGHQDFSTTVLLTQPGQVRTVSIPALVPSAPQVEPPPARAPLESALPERVSRPRPVDRAGLTEPKAATDSGPSVRTWIASGVGAVALTSSAVLAVVAKSKWDDAHDRGDCDATHQCNSVGLRQTAQARRLGNFATASAAVGIAGVASALLFYTVDVTRRAPVQLGMAVAPGSAALRMQGGF